MATAARKVAIVTGANQGLGLALVRDLLKQLSDTTDVFLTARNEERGLASVELLKKEGLSPKFHLLDVSSEDSVRALAAYVKENYGGVDIVISNAGARISKDIPQSEQAESLIQTNNHGTAYMIQQFGPLLRQGSRFVIVASSYGTLVNRDARIVPFFDIEKFTVEEIEKNMDHYVDLCKQGKAEEAGWGDWIIVPSKIGQVASMKIFARQIKEKAQNEDIIINAACPGLIDTDASRPWFDDMSTAKSPDDAAGDVTYLATLPAGTKEPYGELLRYRKVVPWQ